MPSSHGGEVTIRVRHVDLIGKLKKSNPYKVDNHPNYMEVQTQIRLLEYWEEVETYRFRQIELHDDHWNRTMYSIIDAFDEEGGVLTANGVEYRRPDLKKSEWEGGDAEKLMGYGGEQYVNQDGEVVFQWQTWMN